MFCQFIQIIISYSRKQSTYTRICFRVHFVKERLYWSGKVVLLWLAFLPVTSTWHAALELEQSVPQQVVHVHTLKTHVIIGLSSAWLCSDLNIEKKYVCITIIISVKCIWCKLIWQNKSWEEKCYVHIVATSIYIKSWFSIFGRNCPCKLEVILICTVGVVFYLHCNEGIDYVSVEVMKW